MIYDTEYDIIRRLSIVEWPLGKTQRTFLEVDNVSQLTYDIAERAIEFVSPYIRLLMETGVAKRNDLNVVVALRHPSPAGYTVMAEKSFGDPDNWEHPYDKIAYGKTDISARTGLTSREVQLMRPELLERHDVMFWGNAVLGDIIVSCSGVQPWFDEAIANAIAWLCRALIQQDLEDHKANADGDRYDS